MDALTKTAFLEEIEVLAKEYDNSVSNKRPSQTPGFTKQLNQGSKSPDVEPGSSPTQEELTHAFHTGEEI